MSNRIKKHRSEAGLGQTQIAESIGWGQTRWSNYERCERKPDVDDARAIVRAFANFGVTLTLDDLFPGDSGSEAA